MNHQWDGMSCWGLGLLLVAWNSTWFKSCLKKKKITIKTTPTSIWQSFSSKAVAHQHWIWWHNVSTNAVFQPPLTRTANCCPLKMQSSFSLTQALMLTNELPAIAETLGLKRSSKHMNHNQSIRQSIINPASSAAERTDASAISWLEPAAAASGGELGLVNDAVVN